LAASQSDNRAVAWGLLDFNPAKRGVPNPQRRPKEKRPFESWAQIEAVAARLGPVYGPMVVFAAATGLRPSEVFGLEQHDVDREAGVVYVRRAFANGRIKHTKTRLSTRAVPLQAKTVDALDWLPASVNPILFPNGRGGPWALRPSPHLCHLRAPRRRPRVRRLTLHRLEHREDRPPLCRLARDSHLHAVSLLDALAVERAVGATWTSNRSRANALADSTSKPHRR
jgi:integrase